MATVKPFASRRIALALLISAASPLSACGRDSQPAREEGTSGPLKPEDHLAIYTWLHENEYEAMVAVADVFGEKHPGTTVIVNPHYYVREPLKSEYPPDLFMATTLDGRDSLQARVHEGLASSLTDLALRNNWDSIFPLPMLEQASVDGEIFGVPLTFGRINNLYYQIGLFEEAGIDPPESLDDFFESCSVFQERGTTPLALPIVGWGQGLLLFAVLLPEIAGGEFSSNFFRGKADLSGPELPAAISAYDKVLDCTDIDTSVLRWDDVADRFRRSEAAMLITGEFAEAYLEGDMTWEESIAEPLNLGTDFAVRSGFEGGYFVFGVTAIALHKEARSQVAAQEFLKVLASLAGQSAFHKKTRTLPFHPDADVTGFGAPMQEKQREYLEAARNEYRLLPYFGRHTPLEFFQQVFSALVTFAVGGKRACELDPEGSDPVTCSQPARDQEALLEKIRTAYALLE